MEPNNTMGCADRDQATPQTSITDSNDLAFRSAGGYVMNELIRQEVNVVSLSDFINMELPERRLMLSPWLPEQGLAMVYSPRGVGKTFFALNVAFAVATGGRFLSWNAQQPRSVLYIDGEMPASALQERLSAIVQSDKKEPKEGNFKLITPDMQKFGVPDLSTLQGQKLIEQYTNEADLIVVDNISTLCRSGKENEAEGWLEVQGWALRLRAKGKSVLFVHHAGKSGQQRGTSRREDVLDTVINLKATPDHSPENGAKFQIHFTKARGFYGEEAAPLEVALITNSDGTQYWTVDKLSISTYKHVVELLRDGLSQTEIAKELGVNRSTVSRHCRTAKGKGDA